MFEEAVQRVLLDPVLSTLPVICGPTLISAAGYAEVANLIRLNELHVRARGNMVGAAYARVHSQPLEGPPWEADTLYLSPHIQVGPPMSGAHMRGAALILHEATHALQDLRAAPMTTAHAEVAAYLAQAAYFRLHGQTFRDHCLITRAERSHSAEFMLRGDQLLDALEPTAKRLSDAGGGRVSNDEFEAIRHAISRHPAYKERDDYMLSFDGITAHHAL